MDLALLACVGVLAGFMNTLAGGGSLLTLPALLLFGLPADIANGTNRVAVLAQSIASTRFFDREGKFQRQEFSALLLPSLLGALTGAVFAAQLSADILKPVLLIAMTVVALVMLVAPDLLAPTPQSVSPRAPGGREFLVFFGIGIYAGFAQAGVGIFLIAGLGGLLRYDLVQANGMKSALIAASTLVALTVFLFAGQVDWKPGLAMAVGMVVGARLAVWLAIKGSHQLLQRLVLLLVLVSCGAAWLS